MSAVDRETTAREATAHAEAEARIARRRERLRPLGLVVLGVVGIPAVLAHPGPSLHGRGLAILAALVVFGISLLAGIRPGRGERPALGRQTGFVLALAASSLALAALQPHGQTELGPSAAVFIAAVRLPRRIGLPIAGAITAGLALTAALSGDSSTQGVIASVLLCVLLAAMARFMALAGESEDRVQLLYAQLLDARDAQARAAATEERSRIAAELHDVLAHSLSGAAIQLQGARKLIQRTGADPRVDAAVTRAAELVRGGLDDARRAVRTLHGDELPAVEQLPALLHDFRRDQGREVSFTVRGDARRLPADASLALYRGAQEALTNVAKYAPGASVAVTLQHDPRTTTLTIENDRPAAGATGVELAGSGGGFGLAGMRERVVRVGGEMDAGATEDGWRVRLEVPA